MLTKQQAKIFFLVGTFVTFAIFIGLTVYSLKQVQTKIPEDVARGKHIWEKNNCMGCHTIMGEGAYYAPELTNVIDRRGEDFVRAILKSKQPWNPTQQRQMVAYGMSDQEANDVIAFFKWIGNLDLNGFEKVDTKVSPLAADRMKSNN